MQALIESGNDKWLNALTGVSEESRKQFRNGIQDIAAKADVTSSAWDIVCNASSTHESNVRRIEVVFCLYFLSCVCRLLLPFEPAPEKMPKHTKQDKPVSIHRHLS